jgi:2-polyprenyl-6-methoxyphenol hydroxylase-like FAD-dependent oxidoreductase
MVRRPLGHAAVLGGSIAGLLAARVLSDHFQRVTLVERDILAEKPAPRKGVPQGRHAHILLIRGRMILERLFPGLADDLCASGAVPLNVGHELTWHHGGGVRARHETDLTMLSMSRPLLEYEVARRVRALPNLTVLDATRAVGLRPHGSHPVTGVRVRASARVAAIREIEADLVVDATGRGSATPQWLTELGLSPPRADQLPARVTYATCMFTRANSEQGKRAVFVTGAPARRSGGMFPIEGGRWLVTLGSFFDEPTPRDLSAFLDFAASLPIPDIYEAVRHEKPLSGIVHHQFAGGLRRRYEQLDRFPEGLIVLGDGICSFNPVYGQGMTVSAIEAECLGEILAEAERQNGLGADFPLKWFNRIKASLDAAWNGALLEDLLFPELTPQRTAFVRAAQWYMARVHQATHSSGFVTGQFYRVANFLDAPSALFRPRMISRSILGM